MKAFITHVILGNAEAKTVVNFSKTANTLLPRAEDMSMMGQDAQQQQCHLYTTHFRSSP